MSINHLLNQYLESTGAVIDSRKVHPACMFFALKGEHVDGNRFAAHALETGAKYVVVDDPEVIECDNFILVDDVLTALQQLATAYRKRFNIPIIALTGSNGKTTSKELIAAVLSKKYKTAFTQGNLNNHIGVPLTLLSIPEDAEMAVIEMGANHIGEIAFLCDTALPTHGMITNIGKAHLEGFGGEEGVKKGKSELYKYLARENKELFLNASDEVLLSLAPPVKTHTYGIDSSAGVYGTAVDTGVFLKADITIQNHSFEVQTLLSGNYNLHNILAAACIGHHFGISPAEIKQALQEYTPSNHRSQSIETGKNRILMDAYNANPSSMEVALKNFSGIQHPQKVIILGEMLELGTSSEQEHQKIVDIAAEIDNAEILLAGKNYRNCSLHTNIRYFENTAALLLHLQKNPIKNAFILIKGSRGNKLESLLPLL